MAAPMDCLESLEGEDSAERRASGVEVALPSDPAAPAPLCPHGGSASAPSLGGWRQWQGLGWMLCGLFGFVSGREGFLIFFFSRPSSLPRVMLE